jgi:hypothetical protein
MVSITGLREDDSLMPGWIRKLCWSDGSAFAPAALANQCTETTFSVAAVS